MKIGYFTIMMFLCSLFLHSVGLSAPPPTYCTPNSVNGNQINPNKVWRINDLKLARLTLPYYANQGYSFLDVQADYELFQGRGYRLDLIPDVFPSNPNVQNVYYKAWIDFNGDGIFGNSEMVASVWLSLGSAADNVFLYRQMLL